MKSTNKDKVWSILSTNTVNWVVLLLYDINVSFLLIFYEYCSDNAYKSYKFDAYQVVYTCWHQDVMTEELVYIAK